MSDRLDKKEAEQTPFDEHWTPHATATARRCVSVRPSRWSKNARTEAHKNPSRFSVNDQQQRMHASQKTQTRLVGDHTARFLIKIGQHCGACRVRRKLDRLVVKHCRLGFVDVLARLAHGVRICVVGRSQHNQARKTSRITYHCIDNLHQLVCTKGNHALSCPLCPASRNNGL